MGGFSAMAVLLPLPSFRRSEAPGRDPEAPPDEQPTGHVADPVPPGHELLDEHVEREAADPEKVHHPAHEQEAHEDPAAPEAESPVDEPHPESAAGPGAPVGGDEGEGRPAVPEAGPLDRRELIEPRGDEQRRPEHPARD